jgi:tRNA modification GTPase
MWREWISILEQSPTLDDARTELSRALARDDWANWLATPTRIVLAGPPNAGKSTLANALADRQVSLVSEMPGTTRDWVESPGEIGGYPVIWIDTAGLRVSGDELEAAGIQRTMHLIRDADAVLVVLDRSAAGRMDRERFTQAYAALKPAVVIFNKSDLPRDPSMASVAGWARARAVEVSAARRTGLDGLLDSILAALGRPPTEAMEEPAAFLPRHRRGIDAALLARSLSGLLAEIRNIL